MRILVVALLFAAAACNQSTKSGQKSSSDQNRTDDRAELDDQKPTQSKLIGTWIGNCKEFIDFEGDFELAYATEVYNFLNDNQVETYYSLYSDSNCSSALEARKKVSFILSEYITTPQNGTTPGKIDYISPKYSRGFVLALYSLDGKNLRLSSSTFSDPQDCDGPISGSKIGKTQLQSSNRPTGESDDYSDMPTGDIDGPGDCRADVFETFRKAE